MVMQVEIHLNWERKLVKCWI